MAEHRLWAPWRREYVATAGVKWIEEHNAVVFPQVEKHKGTIVKTIGDSVMAYFPSAVQATRAGADILRAIRRLHDQSKSESIADLTCELTDTAIDYEDEDLDAGTAVRRGRARAGKPHAPPATPAKAKGGLLRALTSPLGSRYPEIAIL